MGTNSQSCPVCGEQWERVICMKCRGLGLMNCFAIDIRTGEDVDVTPETFIALPETEDKARKKGGWYIQGDAEECSKCGGAGEVLRTPDGRHSKVV
jgi:hypothetical protein